MTSTMWTTYKFTEVPVSRSLLLASMGAMTAAIATPVVDPVSLPKVVSDPCDASAWTESVKDESEKT